MGIYLEIAEQVLEEIKSGRMALADAPGAEPAPKPPERVLKNLKELTEFIDGSGKTPSRATLKLARMCGLI